MYYSDAYSATGTSAMRTTLNIDDDLLKEAQRLSGVREKAAVVREGLRALIERESARRLALLGGSEPQLEGPRRRRSARS
jgi:Arc/MetJ family transcription regulator